MSFNKKYYCVIINSITNKTLKEYYVYAIDYYFARKKALHNFETKIIPYVPKYRNDNFFDYKVDSLELDENDEHDNKIEVIE